MQSLSAEEASLAGAIARARASGAVLDTVPAAGLPSNAEAAYAIQARVLSERGNTVIGWKVGARSPHGPALCSPLPDDVFHTSPWAVQRSSHPVLGLELEMAFRFGRAFEAGQVYGDAQVMAAVVGMCATIEVVSSRFSAWPQTDRLLQLADLQNHGALIAGEMVPYAPDFPFEQPSASFRFNGAEIFNATPSNPAGDPRWLLVWLVNHCCAHGHRIIPEMLVTTGSYTGMFFPEKAGVAVAKLAGLPEVRLAVE